MGAGCLSDSQIQCLLCSFFSLFYFISLSLSVCVCALYYLITRTPCTMSCVVVWERRQKNSGKRAWNANGSQGMWIGGYGEAVSVWGERARLLEPLSHFVDVITHLHHPPPPIHCWESLLQKGGWWFFFCFCFFAVKGLVNILCFISYIISVTTAHFCHRLHKGAMDNTTWVWLCSKGKQKQSPPPQLTLFTKQAFSQIWLVDLSWQTPALKNKEWTYI